MFPPDNLQQNQTYWHHIYQNHPTSKHEPQTHHTPEALTTANGTEHFIMLPSGWRDRTLKWKRAHDTGNFVPAVISSPEQTVSLTLLRAEMSPCRHEDFMQCLYLYVAVFFFLAVKTNLPLGTINPLEI